MNLRPTGLRQYQLELPLAHEWIWGPRPKTRGECMPGGPLHQRPCPWVTCRHHLYLEVSVTNRAVHLRYKGREVDELPETCSLDVADRHGASIDEVARLLNRTPASVQQVEGSAYHKLRALAGMATGLGRAFDGWLSEWKIGH